MKTIVFEGYLRGMYPNGIQLEADSAAEAIAGLQNFPGFRLDDGVLHTVELPGFPSKDALYARTDAEEILVVPVTEGAGGKKGGLIQIIIGVILIVNAIVAFMVPGLQGVGFGLLMAGTTMLLGGIMAMLMPTPKAPSVAGEEKSKYIPANKNTVKVGTPIPLLYGRRKVYGHFLSFDVDAKNQKGDPLPATPPPANAPGPAVQSQVGENSTVTYIRKLTGI